jgi:pyrroline-5-carboxylate reductase
MKFAIVGAGKISTILTMSLIKEGLYAREEISASDISLKARQLYEQKTGVKCQSSSAKIVREADRIILAVKPQSVNSVVKEISGCCQGKLIISMMAGIPIEKLSKWFGTENIIRIMSNTPIIVDEGATVMACGQAVSEVDKFLTRAMFNSIGTVIELPESKLDAVTALSGSGPAYVFEFIQALAEAGIKLGLDRETAYLLTVQTVLGSAEMLRQDIGQIEDLKKAVTSQGGTTAAGFNVLEKMKFRKLVGKAVQAAAKRSKELGEIKHR